MKIIEETMCYFFGLVLLVFLMLSRMQPYISVFLLHQISRQRICQKVGYYLLPHSSHSYPNFRRSKQILTYIYKSNLFFHDFTIFVTHGCLLQWSGCCYKWKANEEQQMTNFQSTKGFNASTQCKK
jgi:hypothetical protein